MPLKKNDTNETTPETLATETVDATEGAIQTEPPAKKGKKAKTDLTLSDLVERYEKQVEREDESAGAIASYGMELKTAIAELSGDTLVGKITPLDVATYCGCDRVKKLRSGKPKSQLSIDKARRVLRVALVWAEQAKLSAKAPLPEQAATH